MSFCVVHKLLRSVGIAAFLWLALPTAGWAQTFGIPCGIPCAADCGLGHCPPHYHVFVEGPPRLWWRHSCPHPICNPCDLPHFGFYETCWHPWPFPPNWTHCSAPPPSSMVTLNPLVNPNFRQPTPGVLPPAGSIYQDPAALPVPRIVPYSSGSDSGLEELPRPRQIQSGPAILNK